jgi:heptosyltransferase-1
MGDILHALPAVTALRLAHPGWVIDWVVEPRWRALLAAEEGGTDATPQGLKPAFNLQPVSARLKSCPDTKQDSSGAKAPGDHTGLMRGVNPPPPSGSSFSASCKVVPFQESRFPASDKAPTYQINPAQPLVDRIHFAATKEWRKAPLSRETRHEIMALRSALRGGNYDAVIDLQGAVRSAVVGRLAGCPRLIGEDEPRERIARWLFTERVATRGAHVIEQDVELASAVAGDELTPAKPWLPVDAAAEAWAEEFLAACGNGPGSARTGLRPWGENQSVVLINPGAGWGAKRWPVERYAAVARGMIERGLRVVVNAGPGEEPLADEIVKATGGRAETVAPTLGQLIAITRRISLAIAGDTGPLHLACALGRPVVGIYGPTDPSRNGPFGTRFKVLRSPESRRDHTRRAEPEAGLLTITPEDVLQAADELLAEESAL